MRTRRSPRNQERLWRELGGEQPKPRKVDQVAFLERLLARPDVRHRKRLESDLRRAKIAALRKGARRDDEERDRDAD